MTGQGGPLLELVGLVKHFPQNAGPFASSRGTPIRAVDGISITVEEGQTVALVGESGCGKTTTARMVLLLERPTAGSIRFYGQDVSTLRGTTLRQYKRSVQAVFQDPYSSLSPRMRVRDIVGEPLQIHEGLNGKSLSRRVDQLMDRVGLDRVKASHYPHQFSGGQRQRIAIARTLSLSPKLIVLDEPVSSLDVSIRAQILNLLVDLQAELRMSFLLISHDLAVVEFMSHKVAVMYAGRIVESAEADRLYSSPMHPYTEALMAAVPSANPDVPLRAVMTGDVADPGHLPAGCHFHPRCPLRIHLGTPALCHELDPELLESDDRHAVACHFRGRAAATSVVDRHGPNHAIDG